MSDVSSGTINMPLSDSEFSESSSDEVKDNATISFSEEESILEQKGFYCAINECGDKFEFDRLIEENKSYLQIKKDSIEHRFGDRINWYQEDLSKLEQELLEEKNNDNSFFKLDDIRKKLVQVFLDFGYAKKDLINNRLKSLDEEYKKIYEIQNRSYDEQQKIYAKEYRDNKPFFEIVKNRATDFKENMETRHSNIESQLEHMDVGGTWGNVVVKLFSQSMAIVSGWFFSAYLLIHNYKVSEIGSHDVWFFLLKSIYNALGYPVTQHFLGPVAGGYMGPIEPLIKLILFLAIMFWVFGFCDRILMKRHLMRIEDQRQNDVEDWIIQLAREYNNDTETSNLNSYGRFKIQGHTIFDFFLHIFPLLTFAGLVFIIIRMGVDVSDIDKLDTSIAGQLVGTFIATGAGYFIYIFWAKVSDLYKINSITYIAVLTGLLTPLFFLFPITSKSIALIGFIYSIALTALPLAFALRYEGLAVQSQNLSYLIDNATNIIGRYSGPKQVNIYSAEYENKIKKMNDVLIDDLLGINIENVENMQDQPIKKAAEERSEAEKKEKKSRIRDFLESIGINLDSKPEENNEPSDKINNVLEENSEKEPEKIAPTKFDSYLRTEHMELNETEKQNFPEFENKMISIKYELNEAYLEGVAARRKITEMENQVDQIKNKIFSLKNDMITALENARNRSDRKELALRRGFELGLWYIKNNVLFPERDCPPYYFDETKRLNK